MRPLFLLSPFVLSLPPTPLLSDMLTWWVSTCPIQQTVCPICKTAVARATPHGLCGSCFDVLTTNHASRPSLGNFTAAASICRGQCEESPAAVAFAATTASSAHPAVCIQCRRQRIRSFLAELPPGPVDPGWVVARLDQPVLSLALDGTNIYVGSASDTMPLALWKMGRDGGLARQPVDSPQRPVKTLRLTSNNLLVAGCLDGRILCYNSRNFELLWIAEPLSRSDWVYCIDVVAYTTEMHVVRGGKSGSVMAFWAPTKKASSTLRLDTLVGLPASQTASAGGKEVEGEKQSGRQHSKFVAATRRPHEIRKSAHRQRSTNGGRSATDVPKAKTSEHSAKRPKHWSAAQTATAPVGQSLQDAIAAEMRSYEQFRELHLAPAAADPVDRRRCDVPGCRKTFESETTLAAHCFVDAHDNHLRTLERGLSEGHLTASHVLRLSAQPTIQEVSLRKKSASPHGADRFQSKIALLHD